MARRAVVAMPPPPDVDPKLLEEFDKSPDEVTGEKEKIDQECKKGEKGDKEEEEDSKEPTLSLQKRHVAGAAFLIFIVFAAYVFAI